MPIQNFEWVIMKKRTCKKCGENKDINSFPRWTDHRSGRTYIKYICNTCKSRIHRQLNVDKCRERSRRYWRVRKKRNPGMKRKLMELVEQVSCKKCGFFDQRALCFHHRDSKEKEFDIKWALTHGYSLETMLEEAKKCDVLCINCHTKLHYKGKNCKLKEHKKRANRVLKYKKRLLISVGQKPSCKVCGCSDVTCLAFHHIRDKRFPIMNAISQGMSYSKILNEARKCEILCMNCHSIKHVSIQDVSVQMASQEQVVLKKLNACSIS